jgi:hypothetical protein
MCCHCCLGSHYQAALFKVFTILEDVRETQRVHGTMLQSIARQLSATSDEASLPDGLDLPLTSLDQFDNLETKLVDPITQKAMVCF